MVYLLYYMLGAVTFSVIDGYEYKKQNIGKKTLFWICFIGSCVYSGFMYIKGDSFALYLTNLLPTPIYKILAAVTASIMIFTAVCFLRILKNIRLFSYIGEATLCLFSKLLQ